MKQQAFELDHKGLTLRGMTYRPAAEGRHPTVLFLHGFTGQRIETGFMFVHLARALNAKGIACVTFDFLHSGESDGSFDQMLVTGELADALHVSQWMRSQRFVDRSRLALLGFSLGGMLACCVNARLTGYKAMALIAPTTPENLNRFSRQPVEGGRHIMGPHTLHERFFEDLATLKPVADSTKNPRPTLLVQGTGDRAVPPSVSKHYVDAMHHAKVPLLVEQVRDADHGFTSPAWREQLHTILVPWLQRQLG